MDAPESSVNRIGRSIWTVWGYLSGAVSRYLRPEVTDEGNQSVRSRADEIDLKSGVNKINREVKSNNSEKEEKKYNHNDKSTGELKCSPPEVRVQVASVQWENTDAVKDDNNDEFRIDTARKQTYHCAMWSAETGHEGSISSDSESQGCKSGTQVDKESDEGQAERVNANSECKESETFQELDETEQIEQKHGKNEECEEKHEDEKCSKKREDADITDVTVQTELYVQDVEQEQQIRMMDHGEAECIEGFKHADERLIDEMEKKIVGLKDREKTEIDEDQGPELQVPADAFVLEVQDLLPELEYSTEEADGRSKPEGLKVMEIYSNEITEFSKHEVEEMIPGTESEQDMTKSELLESLETLQRLPKEISENNASNNETKLKRTSVLEEFFEPVNTSEDTLQLDLKPDTPENTSETGTGSPVVAIKTEGMFSDLIVCEFPGESRKGPETALAETALGCFEEIKTNLHEPQSLAEEQTETETFVACSVERPESQKAVEEAVEIEQDIETPIKSLGATENQTHQEIDETKFSLKDHVELRTELIVETTETKIIQEAEPFETQSQSSNIRNVTLQTHDLFEFTERECKSSQETMDTFSESLGNSGVSEITGTAEIEHVEEDQTDVKPALTRTLSPAGFLEETLDLQDESERCTEEEQETLDTDVEEAVEIEQDIGTPIESLGAAENQTHQEIDETKFSLKEHVELRTEMIVETTETKIISEDEEPEPFEIQSQSSNIRNVTLQTHDLFEFTERECKSSQETMDTFSESLGNSGVSEITGTAEIEHVEEDQTDVNPALTRTLSPAGFLEETLDLQGESERCTEEEQETLDTDVEEAVEIEQDIETPIESLGPAENQTHQEIDETKFSLKDHVELRTELIVETTETKIIYEDEEAEPFETQSQSSNIRNVTLQTHKLLEFTERECKLSQETMDTFSESLGKSVVSEITGTAEIGHVEEDQTDVKPALTRTLSPAGFLEETLDLQGESERCTEEEQETLDTDVRKTALEYVEEITNQVLKQMIETEMNLVQETEPLVGLSTEEVGDAEYQGPEECVKIGAFVLEEERKLLGETIGSMVELEVETASREVAKQSEQCIISPECERTEADGHCEQQTYLCAGTNHGGSISCDTESDTLVEKEAVSSDEGQAERVCAKSECKESGTALDLDETGQIKQKDGNDEQCDQKHEDEKCERKSEDADVTVQTEPYGQDVEQEIVVNMMDHGETDIIGGFRHASEHLIDEMEKNIVDLKDHEKTEIDEDQGPALQVPADAFVLEEERKLLGETMDSKIELEVENTSSEVVKQNELQSSPQCETNEADGRHEQIQKVVAGETEMSSHEDLMEISRPGMKRGFDRVSKDLPVVKTERKCDLDLQVFEDSSLDFTVQKSRIAVKNPQVRPPKDPRKLLYKVSVEPLLPKPPLCAQRVNVSVPSKGIIGFKLPGLGGGMPALRKTEFGKKAREEGEAERALHPQQKSVAVTEEPVKQEQVSAKPKWTPPKHPGMGSPLMMAELKGKLKKPVKE